MKNNETTGNGMAAPIPCVQCNRDNFMVLRTVATHAMTVNSGLVIIALKGQTLLWMQTTNFAIVKLP